MYPILISKYQICSYFLNPQMTDFYYYFFIFIYFILFFFYFFFIFFYLLFFYFYLFFFCVYELTLANPLIKGNKNSQILWTQKNILLKFGPLFSSIECTKETLKLIENSVHCYGDHEFLKLGYFKRKPMKNGLLFHMYQRACLKGIFGV